MPNHVVVSKDRMRNNRRRERRQQEFIEQGLAAGESVVVDSTNPGPDDRRPLAAIGRLTGARVVGYYFEAAFELSSQRNATRSGDRDFGPRVVLVDVARRLTALTLDEGFDELWLVRAIDGRFHVKPLPTVDRDG